MTLTSALAPAILFLCAATAPRPRTPESLAILCACSQAEAVEALRELEREHVLLHDREENVWRWTGTQESLRRVPVPAPESCPSPFLEFCLRLRDGNVLEGVEDLIPWTESLQNTRHAEASELVFREMLYTLLHMPVRDLDQKARTRFIELCIRLHSMADFQGRAPHVLRVLLLRARGVAHTLPNRSAFSILNTILNVRAMLLENQPQSRTDAPALPTLTENASVPADAAPYLSMYNYFQGNARQALDHFLLAGIRRTQESAPGNTADAMPHSVFSTSFAALAAVQFGDWALAVSMLKGCLRGHARRLNCPVRSWLHTHLATVHLAAGKPDEALEHVDAALTVSITQNLQSFVAAYVALAHYHIACGRPRAAHGVLRQAMTKAGEHGYRWGYSSPWFLDMLHVFHRNGLEALEGYSLEQELDFCLNGHNPLLKAVAARIKGDMLCRSGAPVREVQLLLLKSRAFFKIQQLPIEKCKTCAVLAETCLRSGDRAKALHYALEAWPCYEQFRHLGIYWSNELMPLMPEPRSEESRETPLPSESLRSLFVKALLELNPEDRDFFLLDMLKAVVRVLGADRACLFETDAAGHPRAVKVLNMGQEQLFDKGGRFPLYLVEETLEGVPVYATREALGLPQGNETAEYLCGIPVPPTPERAYALYLEGGTFTRHDELDEAFLLSCGEFLRVALNRWLCALSRSAEQALPPATADDTPHPIIYQSEAMRHVLSLVDNAARSTASVLIYGESGVGKELVARRIHEKSGRTGAFVALNLSSLPEELFESEMLGYERGAFTGAQQRKAGLLEMANLGTLFIDEVPDISPRIQLKLLRLLQERNFLHLGGTRVISSDFRLIVATNRNLFEEMRRGTFRNDLFYRICVVPLSIPPLRERPEDITVLIRHYLEYFSQLHSKSLPTPSPEDWNRLCAYPWPGNIRELKNVMERAVIFSRNGQPAVSFDAEDFGCAAVPSGSPVSTTALLPASDRQKPASGLSAMPETGLLSMRDMEKRHILNALRLTSGKVGGKYGAASLLGIPRSTLYEKMRSLGISPSGGDTPTLT